MTPSTIISHLNPVMLQLVGATGCAYLWLFHGSWVHIHTHTLSYRHTAALIPAVLSVNINGWSHVDWYDSVAEPRTLQLRSADESISTGLMTSSGAATLHCPAGHISLEGGWRGEKTEPILNFMWHKMRSREESLLLVTEFLFSLFWSEYFTDKSKDLPPFIFPRWRGPLKLFIYLCRCTGSCWCLLLSCYCAHIDFISILDQCLY